MKPVLALVLAAGITIPMVSAQSQTIKAQGAAAAGVCAGALEMVAGFLSRSPQGTPEKIAGAQQMRDFFAELAIYDSAEIQANAEAFIRLMSQRMERATSDIERKGIAEEIVKVASGCAASARVRPAQPTQPIPEPLPLDPQPLPLDPQPLQPGTVIE